MLIERLFPMLDYLSPDFYFKKFNDITPKFLLENNIHALLIDVDNTLAPYELEEPNGEILAWLNSLKSNNIGFAFISNNSSDKRINIFNKNIGAPAYAKSGKPFAKKTISKALMCLNTQKENAAFLGDQIFTDVCAGKFYGIKTILVPPIKDKNTLFFRFKRTLERPVINNYLKKHKNK